MPLVKLQSIIRPRCFPAVQERAGGARSLLEISMQALRVDTSPETSSANERLRLIRWEAAGGAGAAAAGGCSAAENANCSRGCTERAGQPGDFWPKFAARVPLASGTPLREIACGMSGCLSSHKLLIFN